MRSYDVIIIGGGLVGAGCAIALRQLNLKVALVDAKAPSADDHRLFALNAGSCHFLENMGAWPAIAALASPIKTVHVSCRGRFGALRLRAADAGLPTLGAVMPAGTIEKALNETLASFQAEDIYRPYHCTGLLQDEQSVTVTISNADDALTLQAALVIGADGAESTVRQLAGISVDKKDYHQSAIVCRTSLARSHHQIAYERFTSHGTLAMLPLVNDECATIWTGCNQIIQQLMQMSDADYLSHCQQNIGYRLGRLQAVSQRYVYPLRQIKANRLSSGRVFLLGNAAQTLHPVAAQGFNLALYQVAVLAAQIRQSFSKASGDLLPALEKAAEMILQQQALSMQVSDRLAAQFDGEASQLYGLLPAGLACLDLLTPLRKRFVTKIMGRDGRVPSLLMSMKS